jgi:hypothetical protein
VIENSRITFLPSGTLIISRFNPDTDTGVYECSAFNDHGFITSNPVRIERNSVRLVGRENVDDSVVLGAINQARRDVETAENESLEILFGNMSKTGEDFFYNSISNSTKAQQNTYIHMEKVQTLSHETQD